MLEAKRYLLVGGSGAPFHVVDSRDPNRGAVFTLHAGAGALALELLRNLNAPSMRGADGRARKEVSSSSAVT
jgi:hypothetical protein